MRKIIGFLMALAGGVIGVIGYQWYQTAQEAKDFGNTLWGLGWYFSDISAADAERIELYGMLGIVAGVIILLVGLAIVIKRV